MRIVSSESYKGFDIKELFLCAGYTTSYITIYQGKERITQLCLYSIKAAKNVIDTYLRSQK